MVARQNISLCEYWRKTKLFQLPHSIPSFPSWFLPSCAVGSLIPTCVFLLRLSMPTSLSPDALVPYSEICQETFLSVLFIALAYSVLCLINPPPHYTNVFPQSKTKCTSRAWSLKQQRSLPSTLQELRCFPCTELCFPMDSCTSEVNQHLQPGSSFGSLYQCHVAL